MIATAYEVPLGEDNGRTTLSTLKTLSTLNG